MDKPPAITLPEIAEIESLVEAIRINNYYPPLHMPRIGEVSRNARRLAEAVPKLIHSYRSVVADRGSREHL